MQTNINEESTDIQEQKAIERLRRSNQELKETLRASGISAGRDFVMTDDNADAAVQRRLERADNAGQQFETFGQLASMLCGSDGSESEWRESFHEWYGEDIEEPEWIQGFVQGALEKFRKITGKL